jgi:hypothetical protein
MEFVALHGDILTEVLISVHSGGELGKVVLGKVEFITFHSDILAKVLITVHSGGEKLVVSWGAANSLNSIHVASGFNLDETSGSWVSGNSEWWFVEVWRSIGGDGTNKS